MDKPMDPHIKNDQFTSHAKRFNSLYINRFIASKCSADMIQQRLFPNAKEVTESWGCFNATRFIDGLDYSDPNMNVVVVGDGTRPRTAATFAFRTAWNCYSVDPLLKGHYDIKRLTVIPKKIEDVSLDLKCVVVMPHSHAKIKDVIKSIKNIQAIISLPCCYADNFGEPDVTYEDDQIWSVHNRINIYNGKI